MATVTKNDSGFFCMCENHSKNQYNLNRYKPELNENYPAKRNTNICILKLQLDNKLYLRTLHKNSTTTTHKLKYIYYYFCT